MRGIDKHEDTAEIVIKDALHLADSLDGMATRDWVERVASAAEWGNLKFSTLQNRGQSLSMQAAEAALFNRVLQIVRARLDFLESLHARNLEG